MSENEEKEPIDIEFTERKVGSENDGNAIKFRLSDVQEENEEVITNDNLIEILQKQTDEEIFPKKVARGLFDDWGIVLNEKKN